MALSPKETATTWFETVWNKKDAAAIDRFLAPKAKMHGLGVAPMLPAEFKQLHQGFCAAFPDIRIEVVRTVSEGELVAVHCHCTGTHRGDGLGVAPTDKPIDMWGMGIARIVDGKILEAWNSFDFLTLYQQVDMLPQLSPAAPAMASR